MRIEITVPEPRDARQGSLVDLVRTVLSDKLFEGEPWDWGQAVAIETFVSYPSNHLEDALHGSLMAAVKTAVAKVPEEHREAAYNAAVEAYAIANRRRDEAIAGMPRPKGPGWLDKLKDSVDKKRRK